MNHLYLIIVLIFLLAIVFALYMAEKRHRTEEGHRAELQNELLRYLLKHGKMGVWRYWPQENKFAPEKDWFQLIGCEPQQCSDFRQQFYQHIDPSDRDRVAQSFTHFIEQKNPIYHEVYSLMSIHRGTVRLEEFGHILTRNEEGLPIEFIGITRDITYEQIGMMDRAKREAMLQAAASSGKVEFWNWDIQRDSMMIEPLFSEFPEHKIGDRYTSKDFFGRIHHDDREGFELELKNFLAGKTGLFRYDFRRCDAPSGDASPPNKDVWKWIKIIAVVYQRDGKGCPTLIAGMSLDIDESKRMSAHLQEDELKLKTLSLELQSKEEELNHLSHSLLQSVSSLGREVRSPLNVAFGVVEDLRDNECDSEKIAKLDKLKTSSKDIFKIVNEMVDIMRLQSQEFHLDIKPFDFKKLLIAVLRPGIDPSAEQMDPHFVVESTISDHIYGDSKRIKQILKDCRDFVHGGDHQETIEVRLDLQYLDGLPFIDLTMSNKLPAAKILEAQHTASDHHLDGSHLGMVDRTIGLTIVEKMIKLMEGSISFERSASVGNQIKILLPYRPYNAELPLDQPVAVNRSQLESSSAKILVVDDSDANRELIRIYLSAFPMSIVMAKDGAEAVQLFQREKIDLILMDIQMPIMDGREAIQVIRNIEKVNNRKPTPIIALSAYILHEEIDQCLKDGSSSVLMKPVKKGILLDEMAKFL